MAQGRRGQLKSANLQLVKQNNLTLLFRLIYAKEPLSRADLAHITGLSPTTVSTLVDELVSDGMVNIVGAAKTTTSGRRPIMLKVNPDGGYMVGVELTPDGFSMAAFDLRMNQVAQIDKSVSDYKLIGQEIISGIEQILARLGADERRLNGVCIGVPGLMDNETRRVVSSTVIPIDEENDFYDVIRARFPDVSLRMGNESGFCAYIEKTHMAREVHSLVYIELNEGIGAGIIIEDRIFTGAFGNAGEFGHISVDLNGKKCKCGNRGCLEAEVNLSAIRDEFKKVLGSECDLSLARGALEAGNRDAYGVLDGICRTLAAGINNVINILNPDAIVIGGAAAQLGDMFLNCVSEHISKISVKSGDKKPIISLSAVKGNPVTQGCARYMLDHALTKNVF